MTIAFPSQSYAEAAMNSIAVDPPFSETKSKKNTITREMRVRPAECGPEAGVLSYLDV